MAVGGFGEFQFDGETERVDFFFFNSEFFQGNSGFEVGDNVGGRIAGSPGVVQRNGVGDDADEFDIAEFFDNQGSHVIPDRKG